MSLLFGRRDVESRIVQGGPLDSWVNGDDATASTSRYTGKNAMKVSAVVACIGVRGSVFAQLPFKAYVDGPDDRSVLAATQPPLLVAPSITVVPSAWRIQMSIARDLWGYAAGLIVARDAAGYPTQVEWLPPWDVKGKQSVTSGPIEWTVNGQPMPSNRILHVPSRWVMPGSPMGIAPLENAGLVELSREVQSFGRAWFINGTVPSFIVYSDDVLDSQKADELGARIQSKWRNRRPAVLGSGLRVDIPEIKGDSTQFIETAQQVRTEIAAVFGVPPEKVGGASSTGSLTYANRDQNQEQFLIDSVNADLVIIQETLSKHLPPSLHVIANTGAFLRSDLKTRYESYTAGIAGGFLTVEEARRWENLPPIASTNLASVAPVAADIPGKG